MFIRPSVPRSWKLSNAARHEGMERETGVSREEPGWAEHGYRRHNQPPGLPLSWALQTSAQRRGPWFHRGLSQWGQPWPCAAGADIFPLSYVFLFCLLQLGRGHVSEFHFFPFHWLLLCREHTLEPAQAQFCGRRVPMVPPQLPLAETEEMNEELQSSRRSITSSTYFPRWIMESFEVLLFGRDSGVKISVDAFVLVVKWESEKFSIVQCQSLSKIFTQECGSQLPPIFNKVLPLLILNHSSTDLPFLLSKGRREEGGLRRNVRPVQARR